MWGNEHGLPGTWVTSVAQPPALDAALEWQKSRVSAVQRASERLLPPLASFPDLQFTHLSVADGLSHSDVRAIVQDQQGFVWFGTWLGGLNRYDGYTFKTYKHNDHEDRSTLTIWSEVGAGSEVELRIPASIAYATARRRSSLAKWAAKA